MAQFYPKLLRYMWSVWRQQDGQGLQYSSMVALLGRKLVNTDHKGRDRGVKGEILDVLLYLFNGFMKGFKRLRQVLRIVSPRDWGVCYMEFSIGARVIEFP